MKVKPLIQLITVMNLVLAVLPMRAALAAADSAAAPESLLQFTAGGHALGFTDGGMYAATGSHALHVDFAEANDVQPESNTPASGQGQAASLSRVSYADLWDGIDLTYTSNADSIYTTTYTLSPGADPADIRLDYNAPLSLNEDGTLSIGFETGAMTESAPIAWQEIQGRRVPVDVSFQVGGEEVSFILGAFDPRYGLTIDPSLEWNTFLGWFGEDNGSDLAMDGSGNVYVIGYSSASWGSPVRAYTNGLDAYAAKLDSNGNLIWNTFLGGIDDDYGAGVVVDGSGNVYVSGYSSGAWESPVRAYTGGDDAFAVKLDSSGNFVWNTFLGGGLADMGINIAVDGSGNAFVTGGSLGTWGNPLRAFTGENTDTFAAKLDSYGNLIWNTFLGGVDDDYGEGIAVDGSGNTYVTGYSYDTWGDPVHPYGGSWDWDAFVAKLDSSGTLAWNTFLMGSESGSGGGCVGNDIAMDDDGNVYVAGMSNTTWGSPVRAYAGHYDAFAAKLQSSTGTLTWNTFLGGSGEDYGVGIAVDGSGNVYVTGTSSKTWGSPVRAYTGDYDAFVAKLTVAPPEAFNKSAPANAAYATTSPTLSWDSSSGADEYEYCYDTSNNNTCDSYWVSTGTSTSASLSGLGDNTTYYWQVRATNIDGITEADGGIWWSFHYRIQSFADVPVSYWAWLYIERLFSAGITGGCANSPLRFCPNSSVTRAEMSILLERGMNGSAYTPPAATGTVFGDVPISHWAAAWIEKLYADGITGGCGGGNYCPEQAVTRAEMAIFLLRAEHGSSYTPPAAAGTVFGDVPISHWAAAWIEQLYAEGITGGCGGGNYCPNQAVTRAEMAVFLVRTFDLP